MSLQDLLQALKKRFTSQQGLSIATFIVGLAILGISAWMGAFNPTGPQLETTHVQKAYAGYCNGTGDTTSVTTTVVENAQYTDDGIVDIEMNWSGTDVDTGSAVTYEIGTLSGSAQGTVVTSGSMSLSGTNTYTATYSSLDDDTYYVNVFYQNLSAESCETDDPGDSIANDTFTIAAAQCDDTATLSANVTNESSDGANDGQVELTFSGTGTVDEYILCDDAGQNCGTPQASNTFTNLGSGSYSAYATYTGEAPASDACDTYGNLTTFDVQVMSSICTDNATVLVDNIQHESGPGGDDGQITVSLSGDSVSDIQYTICDDTNPVTNCNTYTGSFDGSGDVLTGLADGDYVVYAEYYLSGQPQSGGFDCNTSNLGGNTSFSIETPDISCQDTNLDIQITDEQSCGANDGSVNATLNVGTGSTAVSQTVTYTLYTYTGYTVSGAQYANGISNTTGEFDNLAPDDYIIVARYDNGYQTCTEESASFTVESANCGGECSDLGISVTKDDESMCNAEDGSISVSLSGSSAGATFNLYEFEGGVTLGDSPIASNSNGTFTGLPPGVYTVEVAFDSCSVFTTRVYIDEASCTGGGQCDANASATAEITDEQSCNGDDGAITATFSGSGTVQGYTLRQDGTTIDTISTGSTSVTFNNLAPGDYTVRVNYNSEDDTACQELTSTLTVGQYDCTQDYVCGDGDIDPGEECDDGNTTDGDGCSSSCQDEGGGSGGGGSTGGGGSGGGRTSSIPEAICGDGVKAYNEQCDDGNNINYDGCSATCKIEDDDEFEDDDDDEKDMKTTAKIVHKIKTAIQTIQAACKYDDVNYKSRLSRFNDISWEDRYDPSYIMTLYCITKGYDDNFNVNAATGIGEAIKMIAKVHAIGKNYSFNEVTYVRGPLPYADMTNYAWYAPYVMYGKANGLLTGLTDTHPNPNNLKALTPITPAQFTLLMENAGRGGVPFADSESTEDLFSYLGFINPQDQSFTSKYISRKQAAEMVISQFPDKFKNYQYVVGNNLQFYEVLIKRLQSMDRKDQVDYVENMIDKLERTNKKLMGSELNIDVDIIIDFLEDVLENK